MTTHRENAERVADQVIAVAERGLAGLETMMLGWEPEYRAIMWEAVAGIAVRRAKDARKS